MSARGVVGARGRGQSLVEFALVLPIFLLLFFVVMDFGTAIFTYNSLTNAAREGARLAIVNQDTASVIARAKAQVSIAELNVPNVTVDFYQQAPDGTPDTSARARRPPWAASPWCRSRRPTGRSRRSSATSCSGTG